MINNTLYLYQIFIPFIALGTIIFKKLSLNFDFSKKIIILLISLWGLQGIFFLVNLPFIYNFIIFLFFSFFIIYLFFKYKNKSIENNLNLLLPKYAKLAKTIHKTLIITLFLSLYLVALIFKNKFYTSFLLFLLSNLLLCFLFIYLELKKKYIFIIINYFIFSIYLLLSFYTATILITQFKINNILKIYFYMLATISYYPLFNFLKKHIQKTYFVTTKKNDSKLNVFFKKIVTKLSLNQLSNEVISILEHKLNINVISFYFYDYSTDTYDLVKSKKSSASKIKFEAMQQILNNVKYYKTLIYHKFINFNSNLKNLLEQSNIEIVLPLIFDKVFLGCILLSPKKDKTDYSYENLEFLRQITYYSSMAISNLVRYNALKNSYWNSVRALANAIEAKDIYTCGHSERVVKYSLIIGKKMNLSTKELDKLKFGGILHDIGKIAIDDEILKKNSALTEIEKEIIKSHPLEGENIISPISFLEEIKPIVRHHHERWDGTGYPDRLFKERIPLLARIVQLADTFDAITTSRVYRNKRNFDTAVEEIQRCSGSQFDPTIVYYFLKAYSDGLITEEATKYKLL